MTILSWLDARRLSRETRRWGAGTNRVAGITRVVGMDLTRLGSAAENPFEAWLGAGICLGDSTDRDGSRLGAVRRVGRDRTGPADTRERCR